MDITDFLTNLLKKDFKKESKGKSVSSIDVAAEDEIDLLRGIDGIEFDVYPIFETLFICV